MKTREMLERGWENIRALGFVRSYGITTED
ncbi:hypothetical protein ACVIGB_004317 [Bradyrhizobium sp. USDA 4341]